MTTSRRARKKKIARRRADTVPISELVGKQVFEVLLEFDTNTYKVFPFNVGGFACCGPKVFLVGNSLEDHIEIAAETRNLFFTLKGAEEEAARLNEGRAQNHGAIVCRGVDK